MHLQAMRHPASSKTYAPILNLERTAPSTGMATVGVLSHPGQQGPWQANCLDQMWTCQEVIDPPPRNTGELWHLGSHCVGLVQKP